MLDTAAEAPETPKVSLPMFLNLGCAPLLGKTFSRNTPLMPDVDYSDFPQYTAHLTALLPESAVMFPRISGVATVSTENFPFLRILLQHSLPLKEASSLVRDFIHPNNDQNYEQKHKDVIAKLTHPTSFRLAMIIEQFKGTHTNLLTPNSIWPYCHPSLIQYFGLWLALLDSNNYLIALYTMLAITASHPGLLNDHNSLVSPPSRHSSYSIDRFYAIGPAKWLFLLTQVVGAALLPTLDNDNIMQLSSSIRQAIQDAPWLNTPNASRFTDGPKAQKIWSETVAILKNLADSHINTCNAFTASQTDGFPLANGLSTQATPQEIKALRFWFEIETMAHKIQQHGHSAVSYQEVADLFAEHGLDFHTHKAPSA